MTSLLALVALAFAALVGRALLARRAGLRWWEMYWRWRPLRHPFLPAGTLLVVHRRRWSHEPAVFYREELAAPPEGEDLTSLSGVRITCRNLPRGEPVASPYSVSVS